MLRKKDPGNTQRMEQAVGKAVSYELTLADMARRSERRAWRVATASLLVSLALAGGYYYMLPLKEKVPFLVMADAYTGTATVARLTGNFRNQSITANEAINRSNVAQYVLARESYDFQVMGLRDWRLVFLMSDKPVGLTQEARYAKNNPQNPIALYGKEKAVRVKILSITPLGAQPDGGFRGASVRIQRSLLDKRTGVTTYLDNQIVTMRFEYRGNLGLTEDERVLNPLGFWVTEYRVDNDYARGVPVPDEAALQAQAEQAAAWASPAAHAADPDAATVVDSSTGLPLVPSGQPAPGVQVPPQPVLQGQEAPLSNRISTGTADGASNR